MQLSIKYLPNKYITINAEDFYTLEQIKQCFYNEEGIPVDQQRILYSGKILRYNNMQCIRVYSLNKESNLKCIYKDIWFNSLQINKKKIISIAITKHLKLMREKNSFNYLSKKSKTLTHAQELKYGAQLKLLDDTIHKPKFVLTYQRLQKHLKENIFVKRLEPFLTHTKCPYDNEEKNIDYIFNQLNLVGFDKAPYYKFEFPEVIPEKKAV